MSYDFLVMMPVRDGRERAARLVSDLLALFAHTEGCVVLPTDEWDPVDIPGAGPCVQIASVNVRMTEGAVVAVFRPLKSFARRHRLRMEDPQVDEDCVDVQDESALPTGFA